MAGDMKTFDSARRDLLRLSSMGLAASAVSAHSRAGREESRRPGALAACCSTCAPSAPPATARPSIRPPSTRPSKPLRPPAEAPSSFPAGTTSRFSIRLKSHVDLYLSQGCAIIAADSPKPGETTGYMGGTYDAAEPKTAWDAYQDYGHNHWHNSLLWGDGISDFSITGPGLIWGKGLSFGAGPGRPPAGSGASGAGFGPGRPDARRRSGARAGTARRARRDQPAAAQAAGGGGGAGLAAGARPGRGNYTMYQAEQAGVGNKTIGAEELPQRHAARLLHPQGRPLRASWSPAWTTSPSTTSRSTPTATAWTSTAARTCASPTAPSTRPGTTPSCPSPASRSATTAPARTSPSPTATSPAAGSWARVLDGTWKRRSRAHGGTGRIKCGTESNGGFNNIAISNCVFEGCQGLALETVDGALLEDIAVTNITMRDIISCPIFLRLGARLRGPKGSAGRPEHRGRHAEARADLQHHCYNTASRFGSNITGIPGYPVEDLKISDVYVAARRRRHRRVRSKIEVPERENAYPEPGMLGPLPAHGFYFRHVNRLEMSHVEVAPVAPDARPAIYLDDVHRADFFAITAPSSPPAFSFNKSTDMRVLMSRAAPDSTTP